MPLNFSPTVPPFSLFPRLVASFKDKKTIQYTQLGLFHWSTFGALIRDGSTLECIYNAHIYWNNLLPNNSWIMVPLLLTSALKLLKKKIQDHLNLRIKYVKVIKIKSFDSFKYIFFPVMGCHIFYVGYHVSSNFIMLKLYKWHIFGRKCSQNYKKYFEYTIWSNSRPTNNVCNTVYIKCMNVTAQPIYPCSIVFNSLRFYLVFHQ